MRLLFIAETYPPSLGGVAASAGRISRGLSELDCQVDVLALSRQLPAAAVQVEPVSANLRVHHFGQAKNIDFTLQQAQNYVEWLDGRQPFDALWGHYAHVAGFLAAWWGKLWQRPSVVAVRGNDLDRQLFPPGDFGRLRWQLEAASQVVCVSNDLARKVRAIVDRPLTVLPNAVDTELFCPGEPNPQLVAKYNLRPEELVLCFSGELRAKKGLPFLVQAFRETLARRPARLLVIGEVRPKDQAEFQRALLGEPDLNPHLILTGHLPDPQQVVEHLRLADLLVLPALWEGMPNSLLEAMATGVPVLVSDAGGIPEVITDRVNGLLVPKTHLHLLGVRIETWCGQGGGPREKLIAAARETVETHFSPAVERGRLQTLLQTLAVSKTA